MHRKADLAATIWITLGCAFAAGLGVALWILARFGDWSYPAVADRAALIGFFAACSLLAGLAAGAALWLGLRALAALASLAGTRTLAALLALLSATWLFGLLTRPTLQVYSHPLFAGAIAGAFALTALLARGARPWRRSDVAAVLLAGVVLGAVGVWLNLVHIGVSGDPRGSRLNAACLLGGQLLLAAGIRAGERAGEDRAADRPARLHRIVLPALALVAAVAVYPLYQRAYAAGERRRTASADASEASERGAGGAPDLTAPARGRPLSLVVISLDTLRADHLGLYGYPRNTTPHLDRFFRDGVVFTHMRSQAPWTLPTHMSMLTGQHVSTHGARLAPAGGTIDRLPERAVTFAEILRDRGYATAAFTGGGFVGRAYGFDQGFETFEETHRIREAVDLAVPWLAARDARPFLLFLHGFDVHMYDPPKLHPDLPDAGYDGPLRGLDVQRYADLDGFSELDAADLAFLAHLYDNELRGADEQLGRLFAALERAQLLDRTAVVFTSDHGEMFEEHGSTGHSWTLYETLLRVPLLVALPGAHEGRRVSQPVQTIDLAPTLLDLAGLDAPPAMQGRSLRPALTGGTLEPRLAVAEGDAFDSLVALVDGRYKYIHAGVVSHNLLDPRFALLTLRGLLGLYGNGPELYDLADDPAEQRDLAAADPARAERYRELLFQTVEALRAAGSDTGEEGTLTPELEDRLRQLGYID